jgi:hypothetical protein
MRRSITGFWKANRAIGPGRCVKSSGVKAVRLKFSAATRAGEGAVAICVGICLAQSPVERGYWIRQRGQSAR